MEIAAGKKTGTFAIGTVADKLAESTETMTVVLKSATEGVTIADGTGVGTIRDDGKGGGKPDLVVQNARISDTTLKAGDNVRLDWEIKNQDTGQAGSSDVGIYLSKDSTITTGDTRLDTNSTTALAGGATDTNESDSFDLPSNLAPGTYYLGILADYQKVVDESEEGNNALAFQIIVTGGGKPDLVVQNARISDTTLKAGDNVRLDWEIKNQDTGQAGSSDVGIYLSKDSTITTGDTRLDTNSTTALAGGATDTNESDSFDLPSNLAPGTYYLGILADYQKVVDESEEGNNALAFQIIVTGGGKPDLVVQNARISDTTLKAGDNVRLDWEIKNQDTGQAGSSDVGIYLSKDSTITTGDTRLDTNSTTALAGGATDTNESDSFDLPSNLAPGTYYLGILADYQRAVDESNETNNSAYFGILVT